MAEARAAYERCLSLSPQHAHALSNLGSICRQLGDLAAAREYLERAIAVAPDDPGAHYNLGNLYRAGGNLPAAEETLGECASTNWQVIVGESPIQERSSEPS